MFNAFLSVGVAFCLIATTAGAAGVAILRLVCLPQVYRWVDFLLFLHVV
jgi:hypothetical protein